MIFFSAPVPFDQLATASPEDVEEIPVVGGIAITVRQGNEQVIRRIVSTDPSVYLDPRYQPGQKL